MIILQFNIVLSTHTTQFIKIKSHFHYNYYCSLEAFPLVIKALPVEFLGTLAKTCEVNVIVSQSVMQINFQ